MFNPRWSTSGTLDEICEEFHILHFPSKIFLIASKSPGWYKIDNDVWLVVKVDENNWEFYYWADCDPRPFIRIIAALEDH